MYSVRASPIALLSTRFWAISEDICYRHIGHSQAVVVIGLHNAGLIQVVSNKTTSLCETYQLRKFSNLPFLPSSSKTIIVFDKIHIDLWGPALITLIFQFTKFIVDDLPNLFG